MHRELAQISTIRDDRNEFFRLESGLCNEPEVSVNEIHDRERGTPSFIKLPPTVKGSPAVKRDTRALPVLGITLYGTVPSKHCSKCGKKGQDVRDTMLGHERIIFSVHRTRHAAKNSSKSLFALAIDWVNSRIRL